MKKNRFELYNVVHIYMYNIYKYFCNNDWTNLRGSLLSHLQLKLSYFEQQL